MASIELDEASYLSLINSLKELNGKEIKRTQRNALRAAANRLKRAASRTLLMSVPGARKPSRYSPYKPYKNYIRVMKTTEEQTGVTIMSNNAGFLLRFWELGNFRTSPRRTKGKGHTYYTTKTTRRYLKPGLNRGNITATRFFARARQSSQKDVERNLEIDIAKQIDKIWNKKRL